MIYTIILPVNTSIELLLTRHGLTIILLLAYRKISLEVPLFIYFNVGNSSNAC